MNRPQPLLTTPKLRPRWEPNTNDWWWLSGVYPRSNTAKLAWPPHPRVVLCTVEMPEALGHAPAHVMKFDWIRLRAFRAPWGSATPLQVRAFSDPVEFPAGLAFEVHQDLDDNEPWSFQDHMNEWLANRPALVRYLRSRGAVDGDGTPAPVWVEIFAGADQ